MPTVFVISDTHFDHANMLKFRTSNGELCRIFDTVDDMNEYMIEAWNKRVRPQDHVYHLGDVALGRKGLGMVRRLNGHLRLVRGNHDVYDTKYYLAAGFKEIYGIRVLDDLIFSHIPLHPESVKPRWTNVHGHIHNNLAFEPYTPLLGPKYFNASAEVLHYIPRSLEEIRAEIRTWRSCE